MDGFADGSAGSLLTPAAMAHLRALARLIAPRAHTLERQFARHLAGEGFDPTRRKALLAVAPAGVATLLLAPRGAARFVEHVIYHGRRLAMLNVPPSAVAGFLHHAGALLDPLTGGRHQPAREQLHLATVLALNHAFYQVRELEAQAFFGLARAEAEAAGLEDLLQRFVRVLSRIFRARTGAIVLSNGHAPAALRPAYINGDGRGARVLDPALVEGAASWWSYPIVSHGRVAGVIQLAFPKPYPWLPRERELLAAAADRCREAIERTRLLQELAGRERQVVKLAAAARHAEEEERRRIGRELHDETGQALLALRLQLEMFERQSPAEARPPLEDLRGGIERAITDLRRTIAALSPAMLERLGLGAALRHLTARLGKLHGVAVGVRMARDIGDLSPEAAQVIYRVAQESLNNALRHSGARHVNLSLRSADKAIEMIVADDGHGFDAETALAKPMSFGLAGMRERAALVGGTLTIRSSPEKGTSVRLKLPRRSAGDGAQ